MMGKKSSEPFQSQVNGRYTLYTCNKWSTSGSTIKSSSNVYKNAKHNSQPNSFCRRYQQCLHVIVHIWAKTNRVSCHKIIASTDFRLGGVQMQSITYFVVPTFVRFACDHLCAGLGKIGRNTSRKQQQLTLQKERSVVHEQSMPFACVVNMNQPNKVVSRDGHR